MPPRHSFTEVPASRTACCRHVENWGGGGWAGHAKISELLVSGTENRLPGALAPLGCGLRSWLHLGTVAAQPLAQEARLLAHSDNDVAFTMFDLSLFSGAIACSAEEKTSVPQKIRSVT